MKNRKKIMVLFSIVLIIFSIGIVPKEFQNDTFFNIAVGKYICSNGIDMQEHFAFTPGLKYTYSHWAFDILMYWIYNTFDFCGIHLFIVIFTILINFVLFYLLNKRNKQPIVALIITMLSSFSINSAFTARSQIISFLCFIIEIYCIEQFIDTNQKKYAIYMILLSVIIANFHAATWPLIFVLFLPYLACDILNFLSAKHRYPKKIKKMEKELEKLPKDSEKYIECFNKINTYKKILKEKETPVYSRIIFKDSYKFKNLIILMIILLFSGLITPIHDTPYSYIYYSMFGESNFEKGLSVDHINEMVPIVFASNLGIMMFLILFFAFTAFMPAKLKAEHGFLVAGLFVMAISSGRYVYLLVFLGSYVLCDLISRNTETLIPEDMQALEKVLVNKMWYSVLLLFVLFPSLTNVILKSKINLVNEELYPVKATQYILDNLDYKNIKIYNSYNFGSYLMLNNIPVFIDSRLDVYCSEFNNTDIFKDFIEVSSGGVHYEDVFKKYDFSHVLLYNDEIINNYLCKDSNYKLLHKDDNFSLYERLSK